MTAPIRLRQICLITQRLEPVLDQLIAVFGLQVCYGKADLARYGVPNREVPPYQQKFFDGLGLASALLPIGDCFLELVAPTRSDTAGARYLERKGPGGYMVITEVDDLAPYGRRISAEGVRLAGEVDYPTYHELQLDPRDVGASMLSFSQQLEGRPLDGGWFPAGSDWREKVAPGYSGFSRAEITCADPFRTARRWASVIGRPVITKGRNACIELDGADIDFIEGSVSRLTAIEITADDFEQAKERARTLGIATDDDGGIRVCNVAIRSASHKTFQG